MWLDSQEKQHFNELKSSADLKELRATKYPELQLDKMGFKRKPSDNLPLMIMARQRQLMKETMTELVERFKASHANIPLQGRKTSQRQSTLSWHTKAQGLFFFFHPQLGNLNQELTCLVFGFNATRFTNWIRQPMYYPKWASFVVGFEFSDVAHAIPELYRSKYTHVPASSKVCLSDRFKCQHKDKTFVSAAGEESRQMKRKVAKYNDDIVYVTKAAKTVGSGRKIKYPEEEAFLQNAIAYAWETGNPMSRARCYDLLASEFGLDTARPWTDKMRIGSGFISPTLSQWIVRVLVRCGYSVRKESISQSVSTNWLSVAVETSNSIRSTMSKAGVTRLVNMDEMFLNFYPKENHLIVPTNTKRVGANRKEDEKKGCTVVVSCEMFDSKILPPFVVMDGKPDGYLSRRYADWEGEAVVKFQAKHWMDNATALTYLDWLHSCFPNEKIGLIWDHAAAHKSDQILLHAREIGITVAFIPAGMTSILQVCDLVINKPLKAAFKRRYCAFKMRSDPGPGGKYKVERDDVLVWIEEATKELSRKLLVDRSIAGAFKKYGQDPRCEDIAELMDGLQCLQENRIYASLLENQAALDLEE